MGQLVITGCNSTVIFKLIKEIFNQMTFTINVIITNPFMLDIFSGWYVIRSLLSFNVLLNFCSPVGFIGKYREISVIGKLLGYHEPDRQLVGIRWDSRGRQQPHES